MSFKRIRNIGFCSLLVLLVFVGSLPTLITFNISDYNTKFSEDMRVLENISIMNNSFWNAANEFNKLVSQSEGDFNLIITTIGTVRALLNQIEKHLSFENHPHAFEHAGIIKQLKYNIRKFEIAVTRYKNEFEFDQTADQTFQLEKLAYSAFENTNNSLLQLTEGISIEAQKSHIAINRHIKYSQIISIGVLIVGLFVAILVIIKLNSALSKPIHKLVEGAQAIEKGRFESKITIESKDEFGQLAKAFNSMSSNLKRYIDLQKGLSEQARRAAESEKKKSAELSVVAELAEAANRTKSEFLSNMSHELRTPLNHIIGFTELVVDKHFGDLNAEQEEYLADVLSSGKHLLSLVNDILDISKVEAGKLELHKAPVDLRHLLKNGLAMVKEKAINHSIQLSLDTDGIPEIIAADERKLKQVYYNLLSNAVKFTPDQGSVNCTACLSEADGCVEVEVVDTGIGIKPDDLKRIFDLFEQADGSMSRQFEGTGLGLSLTKKLVELHGGKIWAESDGVGQGATFHFTIPTG